MLHWLFSTEKAECLWNWWQISSFLSRYLQSQFYGFFLWSLLAPNTTVLTLLLQILYECSYLFLVNWAETPQGYYWEIFVPKYVTFLTIAHWIYSKVLIDLTNFLFLAYFEMLKVWINTGVLIGLPCVMHLMAYSKNLMISATVNIHTHFDSPSSHMSSSSTPSEMKMSIALTRETELSMEHMAELIGMQSYALFRSSISEMRDLRVC